MELPNLFKQAPPPPVLFHYTTLDGLSGIIKKNALWATNIDYLNDLTEFRHGDGVIQEIVTTKRKSAQGDRKLFFHEMDQIGKMWDRSDFFVASLSEQGNLLSQWRGYAPNTDGFSIGLAWRFRLASTGTSRPGTTSLQRNPSSCLPMMANAG